MKKTKLKNGLTIIEQKRNTDSVVIEIQVNTGSNNENPKQWGISHFLEHMMFNGTKTRTTLELANEIESLGGKFNAATSNERTVYYISVLKKHFNKALEILKEQITQKDIINYHKKFYSPNNITIIISGLDNITTRIKQAFQNLKPQKLSKIKTIKEPKSKSQTIIEKKQLEQSHIVLGYKTIPRSHKDSYIIDVIKAILAKGLSSRLFNELRIKRGLSYSLGAENEVNKDYGYFAMHAGADKKNIPLIKKIFLKQ